jgi:hypothetical protein
MLSSFSLFVWRLRKANLSNRTSLKHVRHYGNRRTVEVNHLTFPFRCVYTFCGEVVTVYFLRRKHNSLRCTVCFSSIAFVRPASVHFVDIAGKLFLHCSGTRLDTSIYSCCSFRCLSVLFCCRHVSVDRHSSTIPVFATVILSSLFMVSVCRPFRGFLFFAV